MKKSQRLRFYALASKQATGALLTDAELTEFRTLSALVALHPSAADDTEDKEETEEEKKKRLEKEKEDEAARKKAEDEEKEKEKARAAKAAKPDLAARLAGALASLKGGSPATVAATLSTVQADLTARTTERDQARNDLATATASLKSSDTALAHLCSALGLTPAALLGKSEDDIRSASDAAVQAALIPGIAALGFNAASLPAPKPGDAQPSSKAELFAAYNALPDSNAKAEFYAKHGKAMLAD